MTLTSLLVSVGIGTFAFVEGPAKATPVAIAGTVLDAGRHPAAGADVSFSLLRFGGGWTREVAQTVTDAQGRFRLEVPGEPGGGPRSGMLWAYRPGALVATYKVSRETLPPDWPIAMVLDEPAHAEFLIRGPAGRPVAGARIQPRVLNRDPFAVPDGLAERLEARAVTDDRGRAVLTAFFPEEISTVFVAAPGLGRQYFGFGFQHGKQEARTIELRPVGRVEGRILAGDPELGRDRKLLVTVWDRRIGPPALGLFFVTTDPQGRFAIPEVPAGELSVHGMPTAGSPWFLQSASGLKVEAGRTTRVEVTATKGIRLKGTVRQRGTGAPIAGAKVYPYSTEGSDDAAVRADAEGRFALFARSGTPPHIMVSPPEGFASLMYGLDLPKVPEGVAEFDLPPIELSRAGTVRGMAVDDRGEPVPGAEVLASWRVNEGPNAVGRTERRAIAGRRGEFLIDRVDAETPVDLSAVAPDGRRTTRAVGSRAGAEPARLVLESSASASLAGRVVDASGHRVAGAKVHLRVQQRYPSGQVKGDALVAIRGGYVIKTNDTGWYRTPPILDPDLDYAALVEAEGCEPARTEWTLGKARTFPELVLRPRAESGLAALEGSVLDRDGRPVAGAAVWTTNESGTPIRSAADAGGRFRLSGIPPRPTFLFVEATGFRFFGRVIGPAAGPTSITLTRSDEPSPIRMTTLPTARPRAEERALARRVLLPYAERAVKEGDESTRLRTLEVLASSDPARVLEVIEAGGFGNPWFNDYLRRACAKALWEDSRAEALDVVEAMQSAEWRARGHLDACDAMPMDERKARVEQVDQALLQARAIAEGDHRVQTLGQIAEHYLDLGEVRKGEALLRETVAAARALPKQGWGGYARGSFAEELSQIDPAAALELIEGVGERPFIYRHRINLMKEVAVRDPARAEAIMATIKEEDELARNVPALCHAMARKDPDRARRIAGRDLGERPSVLAMAFNRPYALGMIALALADTDKPRATHILGEAFDVLKAMAAEGRRGAQDVQDAATVAAALVPVAERIDPALVPEFLWRAASFRGSSKPQMRAATMPDTLLALLLARYDRDAAMVLLRPMLERGPTAEDVRLTSVIQAVAAIDPPRAAALVESLPDEPDLRLDPFKNSKNNARLDLAAFLGRPPSQRWDRITGRLLHLWVVGNEDAF